jgi:hypothetical protein
VDFARELEKLREDAQRAEERLRAAEKRALMEIERERATNVRLLREREEVVRRAEHSEARLHADVQALQTQLGDARQQVGVLEGSLDAVRRANAGYVEELKTLRQQHLASLPGGTAGRRRPQGCPFRRQDRRTEEINVTKPTHRRPRINASTPASTRLSTDWRADALRRTDCAGRRRGQRAASDHRIDRRERPDVQKRREMG